MKFTVRAKAFIGELIDGAALRLSSAKKFVKKHLASVCVTSCALIAVIVLCCVFLPKLSEAVSDNDNKQAAADPTQGAIVIPSGAPAPTTTATPIPTAEPSPTPTPEPLHLKKGDRSGVVVDIQLRLMELNYMDYDEPTNYFGSITREAVRQFQRRNDLEVTGEINAADYSILMSNFAKLYMASLGDEGKDIEEMQKRLHELDYLEKITGTFDEATEDAIKDFQEKNELVVDGMVGSQTKAVLYSEDAVPFSLSKGSEGEDVLMYQQRLFELGYLSTEPDGKYGKDTVQAVKRFQERNDIIVDGHIGPATREALMDKHAKYNKLELTMGGDDVERVQRRLYELNYLKRSEVSSYYGETTENAVKAFQKNNKLTVDGTVGKNTYIALFSDEAVRSAKPVSATPEPTATPKPTKTPRPGSSTPKPTNTPRPGSSTPKPTNGTGNTTEERINNFIKIAKSKLGCPYVRGAKGPDSFDCSGFVYWCLNKAGVQQSYMTSYQWRYTTRYQRISSMNNIKKGDVIVYKMSAYEGHVAIALGNGMMIDASSRNGRVVIRTYESNYWHNCFYCAYRIFGS